MITTRTRLRPLKGKTVVEPQPPQTISPGGIHIPEIAQDKSTEHIVRGICEGQEGFVLGDRVVTSGRVQGTTLDMHRKELKVVRAADVKAVFV